MRGFLLESVGRRLFLLVAGQRVTRTHGRHPWGGGFRFLRFLAVVSFGARAAATGEWAGGSRESLALTSWPVEPFAVHRGSAERKGAAAGKKMRKKERERTRVRSSSGSKELRGCASRAARRSGACVGARGRFASARRFALPSSDHSRHARARVCCSRATRRLLFSRSTFRNALSPLLRF